MISKWSEWKRYPRPGRGENIEAPITPGIYEVRIAGSGALHSFDAVDNVAQALRHAADRFPLLVRAAAIRPRCPTSNTAPARRPRARMPRRPPNA